MTRLAWLAFFIILSILCPAISAGAVAPSIHGTTRTHPSQAPYVPFGLVEIERGSRTLDQIAAGFPAPDEAARLMQGWGWEGNAYFNFAGATAAGTTYLEVSYHLFGSSAGATEAMSYFAAGRALMLGLNPVPIARVGDELLAIAGVRIDGNEVTVYLRTGALLIRISGLAPYGDPTLDVTATAENLLLQTQPQDVSSSGRSVDGLLPSLVDLPAGFIVNAEGHRLRAGVADTFLRPTEADSLLAECGFTSNNYRYFALPSGVPGYIGGAIRIEVSLHVFRDQAGASCALPYYADGRVEAIGLRLVGGYEIGEGAIMLQGPAPNGMGVEVTVYMMISNVLARISVVSPDGAPTADALALSFLVASRS